jgi:hypothetical protein
MGTGRHDGLLTVASHQRSVLLFLINYLEVAIWFAADYALLASFEAFDPPAPHALSILRESLAMMVANTTGAFKLVDLKSGEQIPAAVFWTWVFFIAHTVVGSSSRS